MIPRPLALTSPTHNYLLHNALLPAIHSHWSIWRWRGCIRHTVAVRMVVLFAERKARAVRRPDRMSMVGECCRPRWTVSPRLEGWRGEVVVLARFSEWQTSTTLRRSSCASASFSLARTRFRQGATSTPETAGTLPRYAFPIFETVALGALAVSTLLGCRGHFYAATWTARRYLTGRPTITEHHPRYLG